MRRVLLAAVIVSSGLVLAAQQVRDGKPVVAAGTAEIAGRVVAGATTPAPVRRATVVITGEQSGVRLVAVTDDEGVFAFRSLPADRYSLSASKAAYVPMVYGSKRPGGSGTPVVVTDGQHATVMIALIPGSVITGTVRDVRGRPVPDVAVTAQQYAVSFQTGERVLDSVRIGSAGLIVANYAVDAFPGTSVTDDRGVYRIFGLAAGEYLVSASVRTAPGTAFAITDVHQVTDADIQRAQQLLRGSSLAPGVGSTAGSVRGVDTSRVDYAPVYHPAALSASDASTITLARSEERSDVDVLLRLVPTAVVSGFATRPDGSPVAGVQVAVMDPTSTSSRVLKSTRSNEDGAFAIQGVPPGRYELQAGGLSDGYSGAVEISVAGRDVSTSVVLSPGQTVTGRMVFDGASAPPPAKSVALMISRMPRRLLGGYRFEMTPDGRFTFSQVTPGRYTIRINGRPPAGWVLRSVLLNDADVSDITFEIKPGQNVEGIVATFMDRPAEVSGTLQGADGQPAPEYVLVVFSADPRYWVPRTRRTQQVRPDVTGRIVARDLPAGDYLISAVTDLEEGQWNDPAFLAELAANGPIKITVAEGDKKVQDIRIGRR